MVPIPVVLLPEAVPVFGDEELQVSGSPVMTVLLASVTVGVTAFDPEPATVKELPLMPLISREMDFTGQVKKSNGALTTLPTEARSWVKPGVLAVICAWFKETPLTWLPSEPALLLTVATSVCADCQMNWPTVGVISAPRA